MGQSYAQLFSLIEKSFKVGDINADTIESWLIQGKEGGRIKYGKDKSGKQRYSQSQGMSSAGRTNLRDFSERVGKVGEIYDEISVEGDISELGNLRNKAQSLDVYSNEVIKKVDEAIATAKEVQIQEQELLEKESGDFLIKEFKKAETTEERKDLQRELKESLPDSLRSLKGWETRKGKEAFRSIFDD